jgi:ATPase subunit of ABC transporter with duplicated ATPase domains
MTAAERIAVAGDNGSGKSSLIKAILGDREVRRSGSWFVPKHEEIGYLDQHYATLDPQKSVLGTIQEMVPTWSHGEVRRFLNDFLFRKNGEVNALVSTLSGGEKARLSLAQIAARTPRLLILDEISNNLDLETRGHAIQVLKAYPGAMIIVSHDEDFLRRVYVSCRYEIKDGTLVADYDY